MCTASLYPIRSSVRKWLITLFDQQTRYFRSTWKSIDTTLSSKSLSNISQNDTEKPSGTFSWNFTCSISWADLIRSLTGCFEAPMFASYHYQGLAWKFQTDTGSHPLQKTPRVLKCESEFWLQLGYQKHGLLDHCWTDPFCGFINHYCPYFRLEKCWSPLIQPVKIPRLLHQDVPKCGATCWQ